MVAYSLLRAGSLTDNTWRTLAGRFQAQWRQSRETKRERPKDGGGPELLRCSPAPSGVRAIAIRVSKHERWCTYADESEPSAGREAEKRGTSVEHHRPIWRTGQLGALCSICSTPTSSSLHTICTIPSMRVPEFWTWLVHKGGAGDLKMPLENYEEVKDGSTDDEKDLLFGWIKSAEVKTAILFDEKVDSDLVARVINEGYAPDLTDDEVVQIGRDPFLIAYALASPADRCVVTTEVSAPRKQRQNRRIPDVCTTMGIVCCNTFAMTKALGFKTGWTP